MTIKSAPLSTASPAVHDRTYKSITVVANAQPTTVSVPYPQGVERLRVHPCLEGLPHVTGVVAADLGRTVALPGRTFCAFAEAW
jgi:hypothetical protein